MEQPRLIVWLSGKPVAEVYAADTAGYHLSYLHDGKEPPKQLSLAMPVRSTPWRNDIVEPFLLGFLPDDESMRTALARQHSVRTSDVIGLLGAVGRDCAGAIQFLPDGEFPSDSGKAIRVSDEQIGERLHALRTGATPSWFLDDEHLSLAGTQEKFSLHLSPSDGQWYEVDGEIPTTHIFKPGITRLRAQAFVEVLTMRTLGLMSVSVAHTYFRYFAGEPTVISERWDRVARAGKVYRVVQEDLCQALSVLPRDKYESDGGPSVADVAAGFTHWGLSKQTTLDFVRALVANFMVGGTDAHAKNYALLSPAGQPPRLAPLYDVASVFPYAHRQEKTRLAMKIGGENRLQYIEPRHWDRLASECGVTADDVFGMLYELATVAPEAADLALLQLREELAAHGQILRADEEQAAAVYFERLGEMAGKVLGWFKL